MCLFVRRPINLSSLSEHLSSTRMLEIMYIYTDLHISLRMNIPKLLMLAIIISLALVTGTAGTNMPRSYIRSTIE